MILSSLWRLFLFVAFLMPVLGWAQQLPDSARRVEPRHLSALHDLVRDIDDIAGDPNLSNAFIGIAVQSMESGEFLYRRNENRNFLPASNEKLITSAAALSILGPEFRFTTQLLTSGKISSGVLHGDLIIRGAGDPTFGSPAMYPDSAETFVFEHWADSLASIGVREIQGSIIGDDSYFTEDLYPLGWAIDDEPYYYAMQTSALGFAEDQINVSVLPGTSAGAGVQYELSPMTEYVSIENRATTKADSLKGRTQLDRDTVLALGQTMINITRENGSNSIILSGEIPQSGAAVSEQLSIDNPSRYAAEVFREVLEDRDIKVRGKTLTGLESKKKLPYLKLKVLAQWSSPPMAEIIQVLNKQSNNFYAEQIFRTLGKETIGVGDWKSGTKAVKDFLALAGVAPDRISIYDGSGLSRMDLVQPAQILTLLRYMHQRKKLFPDYFRSLSVMGVDGTLKNRLEETNGQGNIHAKTGFLTGVRSISGYLTTRDNEMLGFSILLNNYTVPVGLANNLQDLILLRLVNFSRK